METRTEYEKMILKEVQDDKGKVPCHAEFI